MVSLPPASETLHDAGEAMNLDDELTDRELLVFIAKMAELMGGMVADRGWNALLPSLTSTLKTSRRMLALVDGEGRLLKRQRGTTGPRSSRPKRSGSA